MRRFQWLQLLNRRSFLALAPTVFAVPAIAQTNADKAKAMIEAASPLGDRVLGKADAPVTLIEYASSTCPHCTEFHVNVLPQIKSEYIDTGKLRFIFREFPLDNLGLAVFMLTRCLPEEKFFATTDLFFRRQQIWAKAKDPSVEITKIMAMTGMDKTDFEACLKNVEMAKAIHGYARKSAADFGIKGTPALFVNGQYIDGHKTMDEVKAALDAAIAAAAN